MDEQKLKAVRDLIHTANTSLLAAKKILSTLIESPEDGFDADMSWLTSYPSGGDKVVEWVFIGDGMLGSDGNIYPVPQNYASKSLLVQGSKLKAIVNPMGKITYKIIGEIPYEVKTGIITKNGEKYSIVTESKTYNVLLAAITFHKCNIGDTVSIRVPEGKDATYAVIEHIIKKS